MSLFSKNEFDNNGCYSYSKIWLVALPILLSMLMEHVIGLTDTAFLGRLGEIELGAAALGVIYHLAFYVLGFGFSVGAQILIARRNGEENYSAIGRIVYISSFFLFLLSILLIMFINIFSPYMLKPLIKSEQVYLATTEYLHWRSYGLIAAFFAAVFRAFFVGITKTKVLTYNSIGMVLANIILNYSLIFGKFGMPQMGIAGAAIASSIAEFVSMFFYVIYTIIKIDLIKYGFNNFKSCFDFKLFRKVLNVSFWMMSQPFLAISVWFVFFLAMEHVGERELAVVNLARSIAALPFILLNSFATAANSLVSNMIGENKSSMVFKLTKKIIISGLILVTPILIIFAIIPKQILMIYTDNSDLINASVSTIYIMCIGSFLQIIGNILFNTVSGTGAVKAVLVIEATTLALYLVSVYFLIIKFPATTPAISWVTEIIYQLIMIIFSYWYLRSGRWLSKKI